MRKVMPVDPIFRIPKKTIDAQHLVNRAIEKFGQFENDRSEWMKRREQFYLSSEDYLSSPFKGLWEGSANFHFPLTEIQKNAMHAMIMQAIFFQYPWFYVDPQEDIDMYRIKKIERFLKYVLERYVNYHNGIYLTVDDWANDLCGEGMAIFSRGWDVIQRRFYTIEKNDDFKSQRLNLQKMLDDTEEKDFGILANEFINMPYVEKSIIRTVFNGPTITAENPVFILFQGDVVDCTDLNRHETVIKVCYFNQNELISFKDSEWMDEEVVDKILETPPLKIGGQRLDSDRRRVEQRQTGVNVESSSASSGVWEFLCVYDTTNLDPKDKNKELADRLQYYVHVDTKSLARWTYLDRVSSNGKIPLHMAHLYRRPRCSIGRGITHTMFSINDGLDILLNQSIDAGMLANNPMFGYKGDSTFDPGEVKIGPGLGIKCDDPNSDIRFFTWNVNPNWSSGIQSSLISMAQQLTGMGPSQMGQVGARVGALRSTSGVNALDRNASMIMDPIIKRVKICISDLFEGLYLDCLDRMPEVQKLTVTGMDGTPLVDEEGNLMKEDITLSELSTKVHFGIYANSLNINRDVIKENAAAVAQFSFQKLPIELGIVGPNEVYNIMEEFHRSIGTLNPERFIKKPTEARALPIDMELAMIMQGKMPPIAPNDPEHESKIEVYESIDPDQAKLEVQYGKVAPNAMEKLKQAIKEHTRYFEMMQQPSNVQNPYGNNQSPTLGLNEGQEAPEQEQPQPPQPQPRPAPQGRPQPQGGNQ